MRKYKDKIIYFIVYVFVSILTEDWFNTLPNWQTELLKTLILLLSLNTAGCIFKLFDDDTK